MESKYCPYSTVLQSRLRHGAADWDNQTKSYQGEIFHSTALNLESADQAKSRQVSWYCSEETTQAKMIYIYKELDYHIKTLPPSRRKAFSVFYAILFPPKWVSIFWSILFLSPACTCKASTKIFPKKTLLIYALRSAESQPIKQRQNLPCTVTFQPCLQIGKQKLRGIRALWGGHKNIRWGAAGSSLVNYETPGAISCDLWVWAKQTSTENLERLPAIPLCAWNSRIILLVGNYGPR